MILLGKLHMAANCAMIQTATLAFTLASSVYLLLGNLRLSPSDIAELTVTRLGYNPSLVTALCDQYVDTWIGILFLFTAFICQIVNMALPIQSDDYWKNGKGIVYGLLLSVAFIAICHLASTPFRKSRLSKVITILTAKQTPEVAQQGAPVNGRGGHH